MKNIAIFTIRVDKDHPDFAEVEKLVAVIQEMIDRGDEETDDYTYCELEEEIIKDRILGQSRKR